MTDSSREEPEWLTDDAKICFADAVIALLAAGATFSVHSVSLPDIAGNDDSFDRLETILLTVLFPDPEHNIMAWISGRSDQMKAEP